MPEVSQGLTDEELAKFIEEQRREEINPDTQNNEPRFTVGRNITDEEVDACIKNICPGCYR